MKTNNRLKLTILAQIMGTLLLTACGSDKPTTTLPPPPPPPISWYAEVAGVWEQQGYGNIMEIDDVNSNYTIYQVNQVSCIKHGTWFLDSLDSELQEKQKNTALDLIVLEYENDDTLKRFDKISQLPALCEDGGTQASQDPEMNFDMVWETINDQYAFFEARGIDWDQIYGTYRGLVNSATTESELFSVVSQLLSETNDGHVSLSNDSATHQAGTPSMLALRIFEEFANQSQTSSLEDYLSQQLNVIETIIVGYLNGMVAQGANEQLAWGELSPSVGYLMVKAMTNYADNSDESTPDLENLRALEPVIQQAMEDLSETQAIVIDLRINTGGQVKSSLEIASYFVEQSMPAFTVKARFANTYTETQTIELEPAQNSIYTGQVVILTSGSTASAAENFILTMLERGDVTLIGEKTEGIFSNQLQKKMPNGWNFTLSNEIYQSIQGISYEATGILPDLEQIILPIEDRINGIDSGLDRAIEFLTSQGIY